MQASGSILAGPGNVKPISVPKNGLCRPFHVEEPSIDPAAIGALAACWRPGKQPLRAPNLCFPMNTVPVTNFHRTLPPPQSDLAAQLLKDPYVFDFLTLEQPFHERELETGLLRHLQDFLVELGSGFAFVGRQVQMEVGDDDFYIDLLFYHLQLRCFIVIDLKVGRFKAEYAGKMNFYLNAVDDRMKHATDQPSIGLILCEDKNKIVAEYALRGMDKSIGVSAYQLTRALPKKLRSALPSIEQIEAELSGKPATKRPKPAASAEGGKRKA